MYGRYNSLFRRTRPLTLLPFVQLYMTCSDKHMVFHLLQSLDVLSNWTSIVCQRAGTPGGPLVPNYEATVEEVGW